MELDEAPPPELGPEPPKRLRLRYAGTCVACGSSLDKGAEAFYNRVAKTVRCIECPADILIGEELDRGLAGGSAMREYERRKAAREARVKGRFGNKLGGVMLAVTSEPQSTRAWQRGSIGEQKLADALSGMEGLHVLHDRRVPGTRGNIDHIVIGPAGVFVVDAKLCKGLIRIRDRGGLFSTDLRLYVGSRDCSQLAVNMAWQVDAIAAALSSAALEPTPPVTPVLCFVDGEWPLIRRPEEFKGVRLEGGRSIRTLVTRSDALTHGQVESIARTLATAFPPK